jgi:hypothetical protein
MSQPVSLGIQKDIQLVFMCKWPYLLSVCVALKILNLFFFILKLFQELQHCSPVGAVLPLQAVEALGDLAALTIGVIS